MFDSTGDIVLQHSFTTLQNQDQPQPAQYIDNGHRLFPFDGEQPGYSAVPPQGGSGNSELRDYNGNLKPQEPDTARVATLAAVRV